MAGVLLTIAFIFKHFYFLNAVTPHPLNSCASVFNYCLACRQNGLESTSLRIGRNAKPNEKVCFCV